MKTIWCVASGPSLTRDDCERLRGQHIIVINSSVALVPFAETLYASDYGWWEHNRDLWRDFEGEKVTWSQTAAQDFGLTHINGNQLRLGLSRGQPDGGGNSGHQAVNLAYLHGARRICLLGYDMQHTRGQIHWHGQHEHTNNPSGKILRRSAELFPALHRALEREGVALINCSRETALDIPRQDMDTCLNT